MRSYSQNFEIDNMPLTVRDASRFVIGAAMIRSKAIESSGNTSITIDNVAQAALQDGPDAATLRLSIDTLADQESSWLRSTPTYNFVSDRVQHNRAAEIEAFASINAALVATMEQGSQALSGDRFAKDQLSDRFIAAFRSIDETPGSAKDRKQLISLLQTQAEDLSPDKAFVTKLLKSSERAYLEADANQILSRYEPLDRSNDFDM